MTNQKAQHSPAPEYIAGGKAAHYRGRYPIFRNYNHGTNLSTAYEVIAVAETEKYAHLLAAAPELLKAVKWAAQFIEQKFGGGSFHENTEKKYIVIGLTNLIARVENGQELNAENKTTKGE